MLNLRENRMIPLTFYPPMRSRHVTCEAKHVLAECAGHDSETKRIKEEISIDRRIKKPSFLIQRYFFSPSFSMSFLLCRIQQRLLVSEV